MGPKTTQLGSDRAGLEFKQWNITTSVIQNSRCQRDNDIHNDDDDDDNYYGGGGGDGGDHDANYNNGGSDN